MNIDCDGSTTPVWPVNEYGVDGGCAFRRRSGTQNERAGLGRGRGRDGARFPPRLGSGRPRLPGPKSRLASPPRSESIDREERRFEARNNPSSGCSFWISRCIVSHL